jgi:hypothetical protein
MESASALIDAKINELGDWRGKTLAKVRILIHDRERRGWSEAAQRDAHRLGA